MISNNKHVLLVEDDVNFGTVLRDYLNLNGYKVVLARNGLEGFEKFKKNEFDICILDVMMPYKDGFTLAKEIRSKDKTTPIVRGMPNCIGPRVLGATIFWAFLSLKAPKNYLQP